MVRIKIRTKTTVLFIAYYDRIVSITVCKQGDMLMALVSLDLFHKHQKKQCNHKVNVYFYVNLIFVSSRQDYTGHRS